MSKDGRTEDATPQRRRKAREEGQVARSQEVAVAASFLALVTVMAVMGSGAVARAREDLTRVLSTAGEPGALADSGGHALTLLVVLAGPFLAGAVIAGLGAGVAQVGIKFNAKLAKPKASNLSLKKGLEKFKPKPASWELSRTVLKLAAVVVVVYPTISSWRSHIANDRTLAGAIERLTGAYGAILVRALILALLIAVADFAYQKKSTATKLKMKREEVKRENRDTEGDPHQKAARRRRQQDLSRNRMMHDVTTADVLVTNPTHLCVALRYDPGEGAPRVVAKGADQLADRLRSAARRHGVPIMRDVPLARALYRRCQIGHHVPAMLYEAVAVVLATAYRRSGRGPGSRLHRSAA